jgi:hypothetical protein
MRLALMIGEKAKAAAKKPAAKKAVNKVRKNREFLPCPCGKGGVDFIHDCMSPMSCGGMQ